VALSIGLASLDPTGDQKPSSMAKMIFVVGGKHSGTTLTATILGANSKCWLIPVESGAYSKKFIRQARQPFIDKVSVIGSEFIVEKTPNHVHQIDKIREDWPESLIFVVSRDPMDKVASVLRRSGKFNETVYDCSNDLTASINAMKHENTLLVDYESIVRDFDNTVQRMCDFAGLEFEESMRKFYENAPTWYEKHFDNPTFKRRSDQMKTPLFDDTGRGLKELTPEQVAQVEFDCMEKYSQLRANRDSMVLY